MAAMFIFYTVYVFLFVCFVVFVLSHNWPYLDKKVKFFNYFLLVWLVCGYKLYRCIWDHSTNIATCKNTLTCCRIDTVKHYMWDKWLLNASQDKNTMKRSTSITDKRTLATVRSKMYNSLNRWVLLKSQTNYCQGLKNAFVFFFPLPRPLNCPRSLSITCMRWTRFRNTLVQDESVDQHSHHGIFLLLGSDKWAIKPASIG